jgi:hypothetical protein
MERQFGQETYFSVISFIDRHMDEKKCETFIDTIINSVEMKRAYNSVSFHYPYKGKGGKGFTYFQPITESYMAMDYWKDLGGGYFIICSCKKFSLNNVLKIFRNYDIRILNIKADKVGIYDKKELLKESKKLVEKK